MTICNTVAGLAIYSLSLYTHMYMRCREELVGVVRWLHGCGAKGSAKDFAPSLEAAYDSYVIDG